jgi:hypothetical protein
MLLRYRHRKLPELWRQLEGHRCHRRSAGNCQTPRPTIRLGPHSRKGLNCVDIGHLGPKPGPKTPPQQRDFHPTIVRLTTRRFVDIAPVSEKGCLNFLYARIFDVSGRQDQELHPGTLTEERWSVESSPAHRAVWECGVALGAFDSARARCRVQSEAIARAARPREGKIALTPQPVLPRDSSRIDGLYEVDHGCELFQRGTRGMM